MAVVRTIPRALLIPVAVLALAGVAFGVWLIGHRAEGVSTLETIAIIFASALLLAIVVFA
jgi:hypothetical protein